MELNDLFGSMLIIGIVLVAVILFLYWKFVCWTASRTNVDSCLTMYIIVLLADALLLKGNTSLVMLLVALLRVDIGNLVNSPIYSKEEFKAIKQGLTSTTKAE